MNLITPLILLIASAGLFFAWINPLYQGNHVDSMGKSDNIISLKASSDSYDEAIKNEGALKTKTISLTTSKSAISYVDMTRINKMLPSSVDNVRLIVEIEDIVKKYNPIGFKGISVLADSNSKKDTKTTSIVNSADQYNTLGLNFSVTMSYPDFVNFLKDLEDNIRLVDIDNISFVANDIGSYDFSVFLKTYWLNNNK